MSSSPPDSPPEGGDFRGKVREARGYEYWATSPEDEETLESSTDEVVAGKLEPTPEKRRFEKGVIRRTLRRFSTLLFFLAVFLGLYLLFNLVQIARAADDNAQAADAIVVLGAAQYNGTPSFVLQERLDHAFNLYEQGLAPLIFTTGTGAEGDIKTEGLVGLEHLLSRGVPEDDIVLIPEGSNTWEQLSASAFQIEQLEIDTVLLVSDKYHNYRLLAIANELGIEAAVSPSTVEPTYQNYLRETVAVSLGRITGYRRLSNLTD